jgi:hypothetical protein
MREDWELVAPAVRERLGAGMTPDAAAREMIASPQYQQPFGGWLSSSRLPAASLLLCDATMPRRWSSRLRVAGWRRPLGALVIRGC